MLFVDNESNTKPYINLALEEYLLRYGPQDEDILLFYINEPSIIIGRHQNTLEEINHQYVEAHGIHVTRRLSGGGAVYHDLNNLNFSFITDNAKENVHNFRKFTEPVIRALHQMGVPAELGGRNDILVDGRKISGNAQYVSTRRMVSHGTLLFNTDLSKVGEALTVKMSKIESKGIKSVRSRVANISEFLAQPMEMSEFHARVKDSLLSGNGSSEVRVHPLTAVDWDGAMKLSVERYQTWDWNFGQSPDFNVQKVNRFACGEVDARIDVQSGVIKTVRFYGDFIGEGDTTELEQRLTGVRFDRAALEAALTDVDTSYYFGGVNRDEFLQFLY